MSRDSEHTSFQYQSRRHKRYLSYASRSLVPARYTKAYHEESISMKADVMGDMSAEPGIAAAGAPHTAEEHLPDNLKALAIKLGTQGPHKVLPTPRLIQLLFNGVYILKTTQAVFVWEHPYYPQLYFPAAILRAYFAARSADLHITPGEQISLPDDPKTALAEQWTISVRGKNLSKVIAFASEAELPHPAKSLAGLVKIDFSSIDQWFEESTPIHIHPKDPFKRIDVLHSTRHIVVKLPDAPHRILADTYSSLHLYETGLPCRFYLPLTRVDASILRRSDTKTHCPYKGTAEYYDVVLPPHHAASTSTPASPDTPTFPAVPTTGSGNADATVYRDLLWYYTTPLPECASIAGLVCFYNEKVVIEVDGEVLATPRTPFSTGGAGGEEKNALSSSAALSSSLGGGGGGPPIKVEAGSAGEEEETVLNMGSVGAPLGVVKEEKGLE